MLFELMVALKYLLPKRHQMSSSVISFISVIVVTLAFWLVLVFLSVTKGIEQKWLNEIIAFNSCIKVVPSNEYHQSYFSNIDLYSPESKFQKRTLSEKLTHPIISPQNLKKLPKYFPKPKQDDSGSLKNPVYSLINAVENVKKKYPLSIEEFDFGIGRLLFYCSDDQTEINSITQNICFSYLSSGKQSEYIKNNIESILNNNNYLNLNPTTEKHTNNTENGIGILVPLLLKDQGLSIGCNGCLKYFDLVNGKASEKSINVFIVGFYNPGFASIGPRFCFMNKDNFQQIRNIHLNTSFDDTNGFFIHVDNIKNTDKAKQLIIKELVKNKSDIFWSIETYKENKLFKPIIEQSNSERKLLSIVAIITMIVACSNIISMQIILFKNKKKEIGILLSLGAKKTSIAVIFCLCSLIIGIAGCILGTLLAYVTLNNINSILNLMNIFQLQDFMQELLYGKNMPSTIDISALKFSCGATMLTSLISGIIPAWKATLTQPSEILRND